MPGDGTQGYTYDGTGNRTGGSYATTTGNRISSDGVWTYSYDANGNITKRSQGTGSETWKYGYDASNHLISVDKWSEDPDVFGTAALQMAADYKYDAFGSRIEKLVDDDGAGANAAVTTRFSLDGWNPAKLPSTSGRGAGGEGISDPPRFDCLPILAGYLAAVPSFMEHARRTDSTATRR